VFMKKREIVIWRLGRGMAMRMVVPDLNSETFVLLQIGRRCFMI